MYQIPPLNHIVSHFHFTIPRGNSDQLPADYLKILYKAVLDFFEELGDDEGNEGRSYCINYTKERVRTISSAMIFAINIQLINQRIRTDFLFFFLFLVKYMHGLVQRSGEILSCGGTVVL